MYSEEYFIDIFDEDESGNTRICEDSQRLEEAVDIIETQLRLERTSLFRGLGTQLPSYDPQELWWWCLEEGSNFAYSILGDGKLTAEEIDADPQF